jgi:O-antigen/teichoic acid export membrane protein
MLVKEISFTLASNIVSLFFSMGSAIILARVLGPEGQGLFALALFMPAIIATFCCFGFETVNTTFAGFYRGNRDSLFLHTLCISLMGSVICVLIMCLFFFWLPVNRGEFGRLSVLTVWLGCLYASVTMFWSMMIALLRGVGKIMTAAMLQILEGFFLFALTIVLVWILKKGVEGAVLAYSLAPLMASVLILWHLREYVTIRPSRFSLAIFAKSISFGWMIALATLASYLVYRIGQGILAYMVSSASIGLYAVAVSLAERMRLLPQSVSAVVLPRLSNDGDGRQKQVPQMFRCMFIVSFFSMLFLGVLGVPAIFLLFGRAYAGSIPSFLALLPGVAILTGSGIFSSDLLARGKPKYSIISGYSILAVNILLSLVLIPMIGILGAAVASSIAYFVSCSMFLKFYLRESGNRFRDMIIKRDDFVFLWNVIKNYLNRIFGKSDYIVPS